jgi:3-deoxy-D-manno-octulosonate 8-phosphate phosphatase (KDO 8-P phosphatase)
VAATKRVAPASLVSAVTVLLESEKYPATVWERARYIKLLVLDVDGVLTDGRIIFTDSGEEIKFFHVRDGQGIKLAQKAGIEVALLTGRHSKVVNRRAQDLGISSVFQGVADKAAILLELGRTRACQTQQIAVVGDDLVDLPLFAQAGLAMAVADAVEDVQKAAHWVTTLPGGRGAVREVCDLLLKAQGKYRALVQAMMAKPSP